MKSILIFQDSVEGTEYDFTRSVRMIKGYGMDPLSVIPALFDADGNDLTTDISESLEYAFGEEIAAASCGYVTDSTALDAMLSRYKAVQGGFPIVAAPSMLSDNGDILVDESVYDSVIDNLLPVTKVLVINHMEAELLAGFECVMPTDFSRAVKKIFNDYNCCSVVKACRDTSMRNILFDGKKVNVFEGSTEDGTPDCSLTAAIACELVSGKEICDAVKDAFARYYEPEKKAETAKKAAPAAKAEPAVKATPVAEKAPAVAAPSVAPEVKAEPEVKASAPAAPVAPEIKPSEEPAPVKRTILTSGILSSGTMTRSLVSPAKSLRDIARSIEVPSAGVGSSASERPSQEPAVTSSLKKESDNQRTLNELAELRARLNKLKGSSSRTPEEGNNAEVMGDL